MLIPVPVVRCDEKFDGEGHPPTLGRCATCPRCGNAAKVPVEGRKLAKAARAALTKLARTCRGDGTHRYVEDLAPGLTFAWLDRGTWRPAYLLRWRVESLVGDVGGSQVRVAYRPGDDGPTATARQKHAARKLRERAEKAQLKLRAKGYKAVLFIGDPLAAARKGA